MFGGSEIHWGSRRRTESGLDHEVMSQIFKNTFTSTKNYENSYVNMVSMLVGRKMKSLRKLSYITEASKFHVITHFPVIIILLLWFFSLHFPLLVGCTCVFVFCAFPCLLCISFLSWVWRSTCNFIILKQDWSGILLARERKHIPRIRQQKKHEKK